MASARFTWWRLAEDRGHDLRHGAGRRGPGEDYRPATIGANKAVLYKTVRASSIHRTPAHPHHPPPGLSKNPASPAVLRIEGGTW
jgi:hypothetical protein